VRLDIGNAKASKPREGFVPNPKLKLLDQVSEVMRFKHYSLRTERTYRDLVVARKVAASTQNQAFNTAKDEHRTSNLQLSTLNERAN
jgi:hypothetical protein